MRASKPQLLVLPAMSGTAASHLISLMVCIGEVTLQSLYPLHSRAACTCRCFAVQFRYVVYPPSGPEGIAHKKMIEEEQRKEAGSATRQ